MGTHLQVGVEGVVVYADGGRDVARAAHSDVDAGVVVGVVGDHHVAVVGGHSGGRESQVVGLCCAGIDAEAQAVAAFLPGQRGFRGIACRSHDVTGGGGDGAGEGLVAAILDGEGLRVGAAHGHIAIGKGCGIHQDHGARLVGLQGQFEVGTVGDDGTAAKDVGLIRIVAASITVTVGHRCVLGGATGTVGTDQAKGGVHHDVVYPVPEEGCGEGVHIPAGVCGLVGAAAPDLGEACGYPA